MEYFPADHTVNPLDRLNDTQQYDEKAVDRAEREALYQSFYCTKRETENPLCSPVKASLVQLRSFPDCLVISAGKDSLKNETEQFAQRLAEAGVTVTMKRIPEAIHGFSVNRTEGWEKHWNSIVISFTGILQKHHFERSRRTYYENYRYKTALRKALSFHSYLHR